MVMLHVIINLNSCVRLHHKNFKGELLVYCWERINGVVKLLH